MTTSRWRPLLTAFIAGAILGGVLLALGIQHNAQGEFFSDSGELDVGYCALIFGSWFVVGAVLGAVGHLLVRVVMKMSRP